MSDQADKQFDPSAQRLRRAREDGDVFRSREVLTAGGLLIGGGMLAVMSGSIFGHLRAIMERTFLQATDAALTITSLPVILTDIGFDITVTLMPVFLVMAASGIGFSVMQSGWNVSAKPLAPKGNRISPLSGLKRIFSKKSIAEFLKSVLKIFIVGPIAYHVIKARMPEIMTLHTLPLQNILSNAGGWAVTLVSQILFAMIALAMVDFIWEKRQHTEKLKMSRQEVQDEAKESDGDPQMKGKRRQMARELLKRPRLDHSVMKADVIITNPTHYAVALRYDATVSDAPIVLVKGMRKRALRIKELARENKVPMVENRPLARALYASVKEGDSIPEELFAAVATILAQVFRNRPRS